MKSIRFGFTMNRNQNPNRQVILYVGFLPHIQTYIASNKRWNGQTALVASSSDCTKKIENPVLISIIKTYVHETVCWLHTKQG